MKDASLIILFGQNTTLYRWNHIGVINTHHSFVSLRCVGVQFSNIIGFEHWEFGFWICFVFRISCFEFFGYFLAGTVEPLRFARAEPEVQLKAINTNFMAQSGLL